MTKINVHPLRVWRASQGLTQLELARKLGYASQSVVRGIETYALDPRATEILLAYATNWKRRKSHEPKDFTRSFNHGA